MIKTKISLLFLIAILVFCPGKSIAAQASDNCAETIVNLKKALADPAENSGQIHWQLGECYFSLQDYKLALAEYQLVLDKYPGTIEQERLFYKLGLAAHKAGWLEQAKNSLLRIRGTLLSLDEKITLHYTRSLVDLELEDYHGAWQSAMEALQLAQNSPALKKELHNYLTDNILKRFPAVELIQIADKYPKKFPGGEALWQLAQMEIKASRSPKAMPLLKRFLADFPADYPNYQAAKQLYAELGEHSSVNRNKIGVILPFSGKLASFGKMVLQGIELALEEENLHRQDKLALIIKDSQGNHARIAELMQELIEQDKVIAVLGPILTKSAQVAAQIANEQKIPLLTPAASGAGITQSGPYVFRNCLTSQQQIDSIAQFAIKQMGIRSFAILYPDNPYGKELAKLFAEQAQAVGISILIERSYAPEETDFRKQIEDIHALAPQAIFLPDYYDKIMMLAPQLTFYSVKEGPNSLERLIKKLPARPKKPPVAPKILLDWQPERFFLYSYISDERPGLFLPEHLEEPNSQCQQITFSARLQKIFNRRHSESKNKKATFQPSANNLNFPCFEQTSTIANIPNKIFLLGINGWYNPRLLQEGDRFLEDAVFPCGFFDKSPSPLVQDFYAHFQQRFLQEPDLLAAQAYDSACLLLEVLRQGAKTRQEVRDGLANLPDFVGVTGSGRFNQEREMQKKLIMVGVKKHAFVPLSGYESWLRRFSSSNPPTLLKERNLEEALPWDLYYLLKPLELFEIQPLEAQENPIF